MTVRLGDRTGSGPDGGGDDDADDETWWDRHGWEVPAPVTTDRVGARAEQPAPADELSGPNETLGAGNVRWSTLLLAVAVLGGVVTLPVLGFTGGPGRVLTPTLWALIGLAVGVGLSHRDPRWDLGDARRAGPLLLWALAYTVTATVGLRFFEGVAGWWVPATALTVLVPVLTTCVRRRVERPGVDRSGVPQV